MVQGAAFEARKSEGEHIPLRISLPIILFPVVLVAFWEMMDSSPHLNDAVCGWLSDIGSMLIGSVIMPIMFILIAVKKRCSERAGRIAMGVGLCLSTLAIWSSYLSMMYRAGLR